MLLTNVAATLFLTGAVWVLQVVQLPLFLETAHVDIAAHRRRNTLLMTPPMIIEAVTAVLLFRIASSALILLVVIWAVTFVKIIPLFRRLEGNDRTAIKALMAWNWVRTGCWTMRAGILLWSIGDRLRI